jgi:hypothetical protein
VVVNGIPSAPFSFTFGPKPGASNIAQNTEASSDDAVASNIGLSNIYPNPASTEANIEFTLATASKVSIHVLDINGKELKQIFDGVLQSGIHSMKLDVGQFSKGVYSVRIITENTSKNLKLVVE